MIRKVFNVSGPFWALWIFFAVFLTAQQGFQRIARAGVSFKPWGHERPHKEWMEVFWGAKKIGYSRSVIVPIKSGYSIREDLWLYLWVMGIPNSMHTSTITNVDSHFLIEKFQFQIDSGVVRFGLSGKVKGNFIVIERGERVQKRVKKLNLKSRPFSPVALPFILKARHLKIGETTEIPIFDPSSLSQVKMLVRAVGKENIDILGQECTALKYNSEMLGHKVHFWIDEEGRLLKQTGAMGLSLVISDSRNARLGIGPGDKKDLYEMVAVEPDKEIIRPRKVKLLRLKIKGLAPAEIRIDPDDMRQIIQGDVLTVRTEDPPKTCSGAVAITPEVRKRLWNFLRPGLNIESDDELIKKKAREITEGTKGPVNRAKKILAWVYNNIEKKPVVGIPSAVQTLVSRVGDCNEHSALLAALLRASGIPAKVCVGLVYARGKFFYHSWNEGFLLGRWVSMDATLNQMPVDATHVKLVQGGLDKQMQIVRVMGRLDLEVLEARSE